MAAGHRLNTPQKITLKILVRKLTMYVAELRASKLWQQMLDGLWVSKHNLNISKENYWVSNESARWVIPHQVRARKYWLVYEIGEFFYWHRLAKPTSRLGYAYVIMYTQKVGLNYLAMH